MAGWIGIVALAALATVGLGRVLALVDRRPPDDLCRPAPPAYRTPAAPPPRQDRLELPPGEEGHLMAAQALHRATGMYLDACEARTPQRH